MFDRRIIFLTLDFVIFTFVCCTNFSSASPGAVLETWETQNSTFKIQVISYEERRFNINGTNYVFEAAAKGSDSWHEIVTFRHDDRPKIPSDQVRFVTEKVGYLYFGWIYAVTNDGGVTWSIWDAKKDLPNWQCCNYNLIHQAQLTTNGSGRMTINQIPQREGEVPQLHTRDYGRHWIVD
jgi:hypothetical protein